MAKAVQIREDYSAAKLRELAKRSKDANQSRRLLSLAAVLEGKDRTEAARMPLIPRLTAASLMQRTPAART